MLQTRRATGLYNMRVMICARVAGSQSTASGEIPATWPDPAAGTNEYFACQDVLSGGEQIIQGMNQSTGVMRLRIKGRSIAVATEDRLKLKVTGELFHITGVMRENADTVLTCERVFQQTVEQ